jgi:hypothetical protein
MKWGWADPALFGDIAVGRSRAAGIISWTNLRSSADRLTWEISVCESDLTAANLIFRCPRAALLFVGSKLEAPSSFALCVPPRCPINTASVFPSFASPNPHNVRCQIRFPRSRPLSRGCFHRSPTPPLPGWLSFPLRSPPPHSHV